MKKTKLLLILFVLFSINLYADELRLKDGSVLVGDIKSFNEGEIVLKTSFAGYITLPAGKITKIATDDNKIVRLENGEIVTGQLLASDTGMQVKTATGVMQTSPTAIAAAWDVGATDPAVLAAQDEQPKWTFEVAAAFTGEIGNSPSNEMKGSAKATREGQDNRLDTSLRFKMSEDELANGTTQRTEDEIIGEVKYTSFFSEKLGWYAREELERDRFENIELRSTTAAGLTWKPVDTKLRKLELSSGLSFRHEKYGFDLNDDGVDDKTGSESFPGLDFGLTHFWKIASWVEMNNKITYNPAFEDLGDYRVDHMSSLDIPLGESDLWNLRFFVENQYNSKVSSSTTDKLDTTCGVSVLLKWK